MKKKLFRIAIALFIFGLISATGTYVYVFHKPHRNIAKEKPAYVIDATRLITEFVDDETLSYEKYGNQVLQVNGEVVNISISDNSASITLIDEMEGISCSFDSLGLVDYKAILQKIDMGDNVELKGQCDGYDMIMGVVLTRCVFSK